MVTEDYVSYETAKLLKEKGFNGILPCVYIDTKKSNKKQCLLDTLCNYNDGHIKDVISAPTLQMAMKWLREVHKLDIDVSIEYKNSKKVYYYSVLKKTIIRDIDCLHSETNFDSYEQACDAAIKYCLENLI